MKKDEVRSKLIELGWEEDIYGNCRKKVDVVKKGTKEVVDERLYRCKMQAQSVRLEVQCIHEETQYSKASKSWVRIDGAYYKDIVLLNDGRLKIGNKLIKGKST